MLENRLFCTVRYNVNYLHCYSSAIVKESFFIVKISRQARCIIVGERCDISKIILDVDWFPILVENKHNALFLLSNGL